MNRRVTVFVGTLMFGGCHSDLTPNTAADIEWTHYGGDAAGTRYSAATAIARKNVGELLVAWKVRTGDFALSSSNDARIKTDTAIANLDLRFESTPVMVQRTLFVSTPFNRVLALDPVNGATRWSFDPKVDRSRHYPEGFTSRGVAVWVDSSADTNAKCATTVFLPTVDARLIALDGTRGVLCERFGSLGVVELRRRAGIAGRDASAADFSVTSPPTVVGSVVVVGSAIRKSSGMNSASGVVRAYDVRTGELRWSFDAIPRGPDNFGFSAWHPDAARKTIGANVWSIISADSERDLVFLPTASAAPDYYGGNRPGRNDFANSVIALRAATGTVVWSFQVVHHDLWDYDVAAQPMLITLERAGRSEPAVVVGTKSGMVFVLHRETGIPIFPVEERSVPKSDVSGELAWPTQPYSVQPQPLLGTILTTDSLFGLDDADRKSCLVVYRGLRNEGIFTPPSLQGTLEWPGHWGGINWDGMAWDPVRQRLVTTLKRVAMIVRLQRRDSLRPLVSDPDGSEYMDQSGAPFAATRMPFIASSGTPCTPPPWSAITALNFSDTSSAVAWQRPLGTVPWLSQFKRYRDWGSLAFGGPLLTAGGLVFAAATQDRHVRAYDIDNGKILFQSELPAGGQAAPMTYVVDGRQFVVIVAGARSGIVDEADWIVAFSLPPKTKRNWRFN